MSLAGLFLLILMPSITVGYADSFQGGIPVNARQNAAAAFEQGQSAQERGDHASAIRFYSAAISQDPSLFQAYYQRAMALLSTGRDSEAEPDLRKVIELQPTFARAHRALGQLWLDQGKTEEALREFERAIELDQKITGVRVYLGSALIKIGRLQDAIKHLQAAAEQGESVALAQALLGLALERGGRADEALAAYSRALEVEPSQAVAREGRARFYEKKGDFKKAAEDLAVAYIAQPSVEMAMKLAGLHTRAGQPQAAIQTYRRILVERPASLEVRAELARLMAENGQLEEALKEISPVIAAHPNDARLLTLAGDLNSNSRPEVAAGFYRRALDIDPSNNRARVQLGAALVRSMQFEPALPILAEALRREPDNYVAHANTATALFKLKQYPEAAREFVWLVQARPEVAISYYFLAISFDRLGDCEQAMRAYQEFVRRGDPAANKTEVEEATLRSGQLQRLIKDKKCMTATKGKGK